MLKRNRLMCVVLPLFFVSPSTLTPFCNKATQVFEKQVDNNKMVLKTDKYGLLVDPIQEQFEKLKLENEKKKAEELLLQKEKELEEQKRNEPQLQTFVLTYYGLLSSECGNTKGITASGKRISRGMIASPPQLKFGTRIMIEGSEYVVEDRGNSNYIKVNNDGSIRLDVYIPRLNGESDSNYYKRIQSKGVKRTQGYIIK